MFRPVVVVVVAIAGLAVPSALANQGGKYHGSIDAGSRANITGSASVPSNGGVIATMRTQSGFDSQTGLFQFGHLKQGATYSSNCGTGTIGFMVERKKKGELGGYICNAFFGVFGSNHRFSVLHVSGGAGWNAYLDGNKIDGPYSLNYTSGIAFAVGEYQGGAPTSYSMTFCPSGGTVWQFTFDGSSWFTIQSATNFNGGGWNIGPLPCPFTISR